MEIRRSLKTRSLDVVRRIFTEPPFEQFLYSLAGGTRYLGMLSRTIPNPYLYKAGSMRNVTRDGFNYALDLSCMMQWVVFWNFKEKQRDRLYSLVNEGDVVLDVGTNIGEMLLHFARLVGNDGFVYGFEPDETNFANAQKNISLNDFQNIHVFNFGVSDKKETQKLYRVDEHNLGMNRILNDAEAARFEDFTVIETDTLDNIVVRNRIQKVDLIKIDIEGYEMHALRGARTVLETFKPKLFIEVGYARLLNLGTSPNELISYLNKFGYKVFHAETEEVITENYDFAPLGEGGIDVYALAENTSSTMMADKKTKP
ncbi:MAG: FkbM family methyltransferase [Pyrinomonadaceae bacterium]